MTTTSRLIIVLSLILGTTGCQTLNNNQDKSAKDDTSTNLSIALAFLDSGRPDKAMFELRALLEKEPKNVKAHTLMGLTQLALKNPAKAVQHLETAWNLEKTAQHALNLSSAYIESKNYGAAQKIIETGLKINEDPPYRNKERFYHNLGLLAERKGSLVAAEKAYRKALVENPTFYLSRVKLATMLDERKKHEEAKEHWEIARNSCPGCFEATRHLAEYYVKKGDTKTALGVVQDYKRIEGLNPVEAKKAAELEVDLKNATTKSATLPNGAENR